MVADVGVRWPGGAPAELGLDGIDADARCVRGDGGGESVGLAEAALALGSCASYLGGRQGRRLGIAL